MKLKGREIPLLYTVYEMKTIQEDMCPLSGLMDKILGRNPENHEDLSAFGGAEHLGNIAKLARILGNAGLEENGEAPDLTEKKILRAMRTEDLLGAINACMDAINEGMASEIPDKDENEPVDVTLEEINRKKDPAG